jgi:hypothetical protein
VITKKRAGRGERRGGKRTRIEPKTKIPTFSLSSPKKLSKAGQQASQNARDRKSLLPSASKEVNKGKPEKSGRGFLSLSRLNILSRPKERK